MNFTIAEIIKGYISNKSYVDRIAGIVKVIEIGTESGRTSRFPVAFNATQGECKKSSVYMDLVPDSKKKSVIYFEDDGIRTVGSQGNNILFQSSLRLVGWLNGKLLGQDSVILSPLVVADIIKTIPSNFINSSPYVKIKINVTGQQPKSAAIFSKYTYTEKENQYLMYPYDYFCLNITTDFQINTSCVPDFDTKDPLACLTPTT